MDDVVIWFTTLLDDHLKTYATILVLAFAVFEVSFRIGAGEITFDQLKRVVDLVPPPKLRKRLQKLVSDQAAHALHLRRARRPLAARWILVWTWFLAAWYVAVSPVSAVISHFIGRVD